MSVIFSAAGTAAIPDGKMKVVLLLVVVVVVLVPTAATADADRWFWHHCYRCYQTHCHSQ